MDHSNSDNATKPTVLDQEILDLEAKIAEMGPTFLDGAPHGLPPEVTLMNKEK